MGFPTYLISSSRQHADKSLNSFCEKYANSDMRSKGKNQNKPLFPFLKKFFFIESQ